MTVQTIERQNKKENEPEIVNKGQNSGKYFNLHKIILKVSNKNLK